METRSLLPKTLSRAAAGNRGGSEVMELILDCRGDQVTITEDVVKVAASNRAEVMELLLDRCGDQVIITEDVVKAAAVVTRMEAR